MISTRQSAAMLGKVVLVRTDGPIRFEGTIEGYKNSFGQHRWLVAPVSGSGDQWFESRRLSGPSAKEIYALEVQS